MRDAAWVHEESNVIKTSIRFLDAILATVFIWKCTVDEVVELVMLCPRCVVK